MKRLTLLLALIANATAAATLDDYAWQFPLTIGSGDVHELVLTPALYDAIARRDGRDLALFTSDGRSVSFGPLPDAPDTPRRDAPYALEIATETREPTSNRDVPVAFPSPQRLSLALRSRVPEAATMRALRVSWRHRAALPANANWRVEGSRRQGAVHAEVMAHSYSLATGIGETRLALSEFDGNALRLSVAPVPPDLEIIGVLAEYDTPPGQVRQYRRAALVADGTAEHAYRFDLPPSLPVNTARIDLGDGGALATVSLSVHENGWWRQLASDTAFDVAVGNANLVRNRLAFPTTRAQQWRLSMEPNIGTPIIDVGYRPDVYLIAQQGPAALILVAGSARAERADFPIEPLMRELRAQFGASWTPPRATLGARSERTGQSALTPVPPPPPYRAWALWSVLIAAALAIAFLAVRLLREAPRD
ncbi:MAG: DUF3999 family protein [Rhodanobacteraceae bacterium]|nr:DUF3999 family protein [Rhodanobacteraceae bacterium]